MIIEAMSNSALFVAKRMSTVGNM